MPWNLFSCCCKDEPVDDTLIENTSGQPANYGATQPRDDQQAPRPESRDNQAAVHGNGKDDQPPKSQLKSILKKTSSDVGVPASEHKEPAKEPSPPCQSGQRSSGHPVPGGDGSSSDSTDPQRQATATSSLPSGSAAVQGTKTMDVGSAPVAARGAPSAAAEEAVQAGGDVGRAGTGKGESVYAGVSASVKDKGEAVGGKTVEGGAGEKGKGAAEMRTKDSSAQGGSQEKQGEAGPTPGGDAQVPLTSALFPDVVTSSGDEVSPSDKAKSGGPADVNEMEASGETLKASDVESSTDTVK